MVEVTSAFGPVRVTGGYASRPDSSLHLTSLNLHYQRDGLRRQLTMSADGVVGFTNDRGQFQQAPGQSLQVALRALSDPAFLAEARSIHGGGIDAQSIEAWRTAVYNQLPPNMRQVSVEEPQRGTRLTTAGFDTPAA